MKRNVLVITRSAVLLALLIVLQAVTKPLGQFVTGTCVNLVLGVAALVCGGWCAVPLALLSPLFAFLLGIGPAFLQLVPMIAAGNLVFVLILCSFRAGKPMLRRISVPLAAAVKFLTLWLLIVRLVLPLLGLAEKQAAVLSASFSWPQLITALSGGLLAAVIRPVLQKAVRPA